MPQINRIRIINFSYNNNNRHIVDETFDFYSGENALLNLKNGGGKSVLVQLILQPIIPKAKLMSRRIEDFFKGKKTPSYILIEWKLEDQGGYLLTGIGLTNRQSKVRETDEVNNRLKYFTFTNNYRESNLFDIENIPLVRKESKGIYIEDYNNAKKLISSKEKELNFSIKLFTDEDSYNYKKHLESFNISQDEFKSIVLKINESEGGVIEIFEKCRTSQQLMNDWILKTVEKVVNKDDNDKNKLEEMLENLVEEMINNEQFIHEKEIYEEFLRESKEYLEMLNDLITSLDEEEKKENNLVKMYYYLKNEINKIKDEIENQKRITEESYEELKRIDLEERSKDYYDILDKVNELNIKFDEENKKLNDIKENIKLYKRKEIVQKASREYRHIKKLKVRIASIKEEIEKIKNSNVNKEKIKNLEYSLKIEYEKILDKLNNDLNEIEDKEKELQIKLDEYKKKVNEIDNRNNDLLNRKGKLESKILIFEENEIKIKRELNLNYTRNLLGEIEESFNQKYLSLLEDNIRNLKEKKANNSNEIEKAKERIQSIENEIKILNSNINENTINLAKLNEKINEYKALEENIKNILNKYNINFGRRFNHKENILYLQNEINELQRIERDIDLDIRTINENIISLKNGTLHVSKEFREFLINKDISFETGENYLRKQSIDIRRKLTKENPILPFSFILYEEEIEKLKNLDINLNIHQMVPVLSYSDLNKTCNSDGNLVYLDKLQFMCLYDDKMIITESIESYLKQLNNELESKKEKHLHYKNELDKAREDLQVLKSFSFDKNYIYDLSTEKDNVEKENLKLEGKTKDLDLEKKRLTEKIEKLKDEINSISNKLKKLEENILRFNEFIKENEKYLKNKQLYKSIEEEINSLSKEKELIKVKIDDIDKVSKDIYKKKIELENEFRIKSNKYEKYKDSIEGELLFEDIDTLESILEVLKKEITSNLERLEDDLKIKQSELKEKVDILKSYNLEEKEYINIIYEYEYLKEIQNTVRTLENEKNEIDIKSRNINGELQKYKGKLESAEKEVKKLAENPLDKSLIKLNFEERRKLENEKIKLSRKKIDEFISISDKYQNITNKIEGTIDITKYKVDISYSIYESIDEDYKRLTNEIKEIKKENEVKIDNTSNNYYRLKGHFKNKNIHIENIFLALDILFERAKSDKNKYYYLAERLMESNDSLNNFIRVCELKLSNLEKNKNDMIQHSYLHGKLIYEEIQKIAENSSIKLEGKSRPIHMLKIEMEPLKDNEEENITLMKGYIENCIRIIKDDMKADKKTEEIRRKINKYMSSKELLNVLSDLGKMSIKAFKIDINTKNSKYKTWEQVMKENSGGERFVSFFAVLVALMSYTRTSAKFEDDYIRNKDTKVLIMDNPFGPISSEHLLKPLFNIAKKYNTQLICLTDLKQNSILNCFNLIYMIKIRQNVIGTSEYIQLERQIKENADLEKDENLEKAVFKANNIERIMLF